MGDHAHAGEHHVHWHTSPYPLMVGFGLCFFLPWAFMFQFNYHQGLLAVICLALGLLMAIAGGVGWVAETVGVIDDEGWSPSAMMMFIGTEIMTILGVLAAYWTIRLEAPVWPPEGTPHIDAHGPLIWTIILIASSITIGLGRRAALNGNASGLANMTLLSIGIWIAFAVGLIMSWSDLASQGFTIGVNAYATALYGFTGIHMAHLIFGAAIMMLSLRPSFSGLISPSYCRAMTMYVHFVNILGIWALLQVYYW